jgi:uncharacterized OB-fold protein
MEITDEMVLAAYPTVPIDHDSKAYWKGCLQKRLLINRCRDCGYYIHFPRPMCPRCWSENVAPTEVGGKGSVHLLSFHHQGPGTTGALSEPHPAVSVELVEQEGLRLTSTVVNCPNEDIYIGMPVELTWIDWQGAPVPAFQPAPDAVREGRPR